MHCPNCRNKRRRRQLRAKEAVKEAVGAGRMERKPCEVCGKVKSEGHHPDYVKRYEVIWLCQKHHQERHAISR